MNGIKPKQEKYHNMQNQRNRVLEFIKNNGGQATSNELKSWACNMAYIGCPDRRARDLVASGNLISYLMTDEEKEQYRYNIRVQIYKITDKGICALQRSADCQEILADITYPKKKERIFTY